MTKAPAFQFYVKDWLSDPALQMATSSTRGIWINALCYMWESKDRGRISGERLAMARLLVCNNGELDHFLQQAEDLKFCDVERQENVRGDEILTLINRRMFREEKTKKLHRERQHRYEDKKLDKLTDGISDAEVTHASSSSTASAIKEKIKPLRENLSRPPDPHVKEFIDFYFQEFNGRFRINPIIEGGKDGTLIKTLLGKIDFNELKILLIDFLDSDDPFIQKTGYTIGAFKSQIQKLRIKPSPGGKTFGAARMWLKKQEERDAEKGRKKISYGIIENKGIPSGNESDSGRGGP